VTDKNTTFEENINLRKELFDDYISWKVCKICFFERLTTRNKNIKTHILLELGCRCQKNTTTLNYLFPKMHKQLAYQVLEVLDCPKNLVSNF